MSSVRDEILREQALCRAWFHPDLTDGDREWMRQHLELAGEQPPRHDLSWLTWELVR